MAEFEITAIIHGQNRFSAVAFSQDGMLLAAASGDQIFLNDATSGHLFCTMEGHDDQITVLAFSKSCRDEIILASGSRDCCCLFWNIRSELDQNFDPPKVIPHCFTYLKISENRQPIVSLEFCFSDRYVATASMDGAIGFVSTGDVASARNSRFNPTRNRILTGREICSIGLSPDDIHVIAGYSTGRVEIFQTKTGDLVMAHRRHQMQVSSICYSPDGTFLASGSWDRTVKLSPTIQLAETRVLTLDAAVFSVVFSPLNHILACGLGVPANSILLWDWRNGARARLLAFQPAPHGIAFSPDGAMLACAVHGNRVAVHDLSRSRVALALAMALHPRLGGCSGLSAMEPALVRMIARYLCELSS